MVVLRFSGPTSGHADQVHAARAQQKQQLPAREGGLRGKEPAPARQPPCVHNGLYEFADQRRPDGLGDFLKARRAQLTPHEVGLPEAGTHRKVAGLRREEVAQLAAISVDYLHPA